MTQSPSLPELPKLPDYFEDFMDRTRQEVQAYATAHGLACYEAGSAAAAQAAWQPIATAPHGVRVLLGPREAPVVGIVKHPPEWEEERNPVCSVVHYNGNVFVAGYHCSEWMPLPAAPTQGAEGAASQAATGEDLAIYDSIARNYMRDGKPATHAEARCGFPKEGTE